MEIEKEKIVECCNCNYIHSFGDRIVEVEQGSVFDTTKYLCPKCKEESFYNDHETNRR